MKVEPAPLSVAPTAGLTVDVAVVVVTIVLEVIEVETEVVVMTLVTVGVVLPAPDERTYAPPAAIRATTITIAATTPVPTARLEFRFISVQPCRRASDILLAELFYWII